MARETAGTLNELLADWVPTDPDQTLRLDLATSLSISFVGRVASGETVRTVQIAGWRDGGRATKIGPVFLDPDGWEPTLAAIGKVLDELAATRRESDNGA